MLVFKKLVGPFLFPLPLAFGLLLAGVVLLWRGRRPRAGKVLVTLALVWLAVFSFRPVPHLLLGRLEATYPTFDPALADSAAGGTTGSTTGGTTVRWVVVLDGGGAARPDLSPPDRLARSTLVRLVEGLRVLRHYPGARLLVTGRRLAAGTSTAALMREAAVTLGADATRIVLEEEGYDTETQAVRVGRLVGQDPFVLVTSAAHMRRAVALFRRQGLAPLPAPTDHLVKTPAFVWSEIHPEANYLEEATTWFYETLGLAWARLNGRA